jgi:hypothetical protein
VAAHTKSRRRDAFKNEELGRTARAGDENGFDEKDIVWNITFTWALRSGVDSSKREVNDETRSDRRQRGHFGFNRLGGVGECTRQYQPEPLPE